MNDYGPFAVLATVIAILVTYTTRRRKLGRIDHLLVGLLVISALASSYWIFFKEQAAPVGVISTVADPAPAPSTSTTIITSAPNAPVISDVQGDVQVEIIERPSEEKAGASFRITYYRMNSFSLNYLVNGRLSPQWSEIFGGQQYIVRNPVYVELDNFLTKFAEPIFGDVIQVQANDTKQFYDFTSQQIWERSGDNAVLTNPELLRAYLRGVGFYLFFIPDTNAATTILSTSSWPLNYSFNYSPYSGNNLTAIGTHDRYWLELPSIWRSLSRDDLRMYSRDLERFRGRFERDETFAWCGDTFGDVCMQGTDASRDLIIDSIKYITRNGMPEHFMHAYAERGAHSGWTIHAVARDLVLLVAVLENLDDKPIEVGLAEVREVHRSTLRLPAETDKLAARSDPKSTLLLPQRVLAVGEKLIIPMRLQFAHLKDFGPTPRDEDQAEIDTILSALADLGSQTVDVVTAGEGGDRVLARKSASSFRANSPPPRIDRFDYGPSWVIESIVIEDQRVEFRPHSDENFLMFSGTETGSCPTVFTYQPLLKTWIYEGHILTGATTSSNKRTDEMELAYFHGRVKLAEMDDEISFIDEVELAIRHPDGQETVVSSSSPTLAKDDNRMLVLRRGQEFEADFGQHDWINDGDRVFLRVTGFYRPYEFTMD